jgi:hypothetical protein
MYVVASVCDDLTGSTSPGEGEQRAFGFLKLKRIRRTYLKTNGGDCPFCEATLEFSAPRAIGEDPPVRVSCRGCGRVDHFAATASDGSSWNSPLYEPVAKPESSLVPGSDFDPSVALLQEDLELAQALEQVGPALGACYRQAVRDIRQPDRESYVGSAAALRELLSFVLREKAPDADVRAEPGFTPETEDGRPTRRQRVRFILKQRGRSGNEDAVDRAWHGLDTIVVDTYSRASKGTHLGPGGRQEVETLANYIRAILRDLLL